jgi:2-oxoglutarate/2-oxoacid ferredoxin oxidoreductase subunit alpha
MNMGQMVDDVRLAVNGRRPVSFFGRAGGIIPTPLEVLGDIERVAAESGVAQERVAVAEGGAL